MGADTTPAASNDGAGKRSKTPRAATFTTAGSDGNSLTGIEETIQGAFHFLPAPADVLSALTVGYRWRELARTDSVWRARFEREGMVEKARVFEVPLPAAEGGGSNGRSIAAAAAEDVEVVLAGVGLPFYAQVFALKVRVLRSLRGRTFPPHPFTAARTRVFAARCAILYLGRDTR